MARTARTVLPTDLVALVSYDGRVYSNEAMTKDRLGTQASPHPLETAFEQWFSFATGRHTCVSVKGPTLRGLISAGKRGNKQAWEIDCLIDATEGDSGVLMSLLDQITEAAGRSGALRIFVRLPADSHSAIEAPRCAFVPYARERVYRRAMHDVDAGRSAEGLRRRTKADQHAVFHLYSALVPAEIRQVEGMTQGEWLASQESLGRTTQYVLDAPDGSGGLAGWLRVAGDGDIGRFELVAQPDAIDMLLDAALSKVANRDWAYVMVPEYECSLGSALEARGFEAGEAYTVLTRRTVRPVRIAAKIPAVAQTTFG